MIDYAEMHVSQAEMTESRLRLQRARKASGKTPDDLAEFVGNSQSNYYDLENCDGELFTTISLRELSQLCSALGIKPRELFDGPTNAEQTISPEQLVSEAKAYLSQNRMSVAEFEESIGFEIGPSLKDTSKVLEWNVDFLRWLCSRLELDWRSVSYRGKTYATTQT